MLPSMFIVLVGIISSILLFSVLLYWRKTKPLFLLIGKLGIRICVAALGLYLLNWAGDLIDFRLAINPITVGIIAVLGVPGVVALALLKYMIV